MKVHPSGTNLVQQSAASANGTQGRATHFNPFKDTSSFTGLPSGYATLNYNEASDRNAGTLEQGALRVDGNNYMHYKSDIRFGPGGITTGKYYWEISFKDGNNQSAPYCGITGNFEQDGGEIAGSGDKAWFNHLYFSRYTQSGSTATSNEGDYKGFQEGDTFGFAVDLDARIFYGYRHGSLVFYDTTIPDANTTKFAPFVFSTNDGQSGGYWSDTTFNFGQRPFKHTVPEGFSPIATNNITPGILRAQKHFDTVLYTGNDSTNVITGLEFQPDFVWIKQRNGTFWHQLFDSVRGVNKRLYSNRTDVESTSDPTLTSFNSNGFTLGDDDGGINGGTNTYVAWCWKAGGTAVTNTVGNISAQVSANDEAGFSIITYTGDGNTSGNVGTGLRSTQPLAMAIVKRRDDTSDWHVGHIASGQSSNFAYHTNLNDTSTLSGSAPYHMGTQNATNGDRLYLAEGGLTSSATYVAYVWQERPGYSNFGSYKGNGSSDGSFVETGFRPAFVLTKIVDTINENWTISDSTRSTYNPVDAFLRPDESTAETSGAATMDFLSNGFKLRTSDSKTNWDGGLFIYMAFAERPHVSPFGTQSNAR